MMGRSSRFERKILAAMGIVGVATLIGALALGRVALENAYQIGVNAEIEAQLRQGVDAYRAQLVALRGDAERTADAVAFHFALRDAILRDDRDAARAYFGEALVGYPNVGAVVARRGRTVFASARDAERLDPETMRTLVRRRSLPGAGDDVTVDVSVVAPRATFDAFQKAGEVAEVYGRLLDQTTYVSGVYARVYIVLLAGVIAFAMLAGAIVSRRVTRRVLVLAEATRKVGAGDLGVQVPRESRDEVGELTEAFNAMVRDLRDSRARIDYLQRIGAWQEFARRLAHEIKNPLTPIQLAVQEVHESYDGADPRYREKLEDARAIVEEEVATLRRLVGEFSAFAKLPEASLERADLAQFVDDLAKQMPAVLEDAGHGHERAPVDIAVSRLPGEMPILMDPMMLKRCIDNLVRNAVEAVYAIHPEGGGRVDIAVRAEGDRAVLEISDNGPGVPEADRERVFDPYYTTKTEGTGLGLAIVKKIVLEHRGRIACGVSPEGGARFTLSFPRLGKR